ncbi:MAG: M28 family peptidase [Deltaproteobacteria bacterium]|nr:M28 family peptidase [Deltaproteobacteria bacterium]
MNRHLPCLFMGVVGLVACGDDDESADVADTVTTASDTTTATDTTTTTATDTTATTATDTTATTDAAAEETEVAEDTSVPWTPVVYTYPTCGAQAADLAGCVETARLDATLAAIVGSRFPGEPKWQEAQDLCKTTLTDLGYTVTLQPTLLGQNVIGVKTGAEKPDEQVIVGAHYDGVRGCDAADDNGSGVAGLLEVARVLAPGTHARTLVIACWDVEELGLIGSQVHARASDASQIVAVYDFDMIGYTDDTPGSQTFPVGFDLLFPEAAATLASLGGRGVFITLIANPNAAGQVTALASAAAAIGLPIVEVVVPDTLLGSSALGDLRRSDHATFWALGAPAVHLTDTANFRNPNYHCPNGNTDTVATVDMAFVRAVTATTIVAAKTTLDAEDTGTFHTPHTPECDVIVQDCGEGQRCAFTVDGNNVWARRCIDRVAEPVALDAICQRTGPAGVDTCDAGLYCALNGGVRTNTDIASPTFDRVCSPLCTEASDCAEGATCLGVGAPFHEPTGICLPRCADPFGDACGADRKCEPTRRLEGAVFELVCSPKGPLAAGEEGCVFGIDCGPGFGCTQEGATRVCRSYCDATHACPGGQVCRPIVMADLASDLGLCAVE